MLFWAREFLCSRCRPVALWLIPSLASTLFLVTQAADFDQAQKLFLDGKYEQAVQIAGQGIQDRTRNEDWQILLSQSLLTLGRYAEAQNAISNALSRNPFSLRLRLAARDVFHQNGHTEQAKQLVQEIGELVQTRNWANRDPAGVVALGQGALLLGADARKVLENFFHRVKKSNPEYRETYLAIGQLALDKYDSELAAKAFQEGLDRFPDDPEMLYGLAKSYSTGDRSEMLPLLEKALDRNERHTPSLLLLADHLIDAEEYSKAEDLLTKVVAVNPHHPEAWAYRAVLAHLRNQPPEEEKAREEAVAVWKNNPKVDYLIGLKLSQKYRFAEGSTYQRRALKSEEDYLPAKSQLAQDLLRLGEEEEGWSMAEDAFKQDGYDVVAFNLVTLHDTLSKFRAVTNADFRIRMSPHEAGVYGSRVTHLLERAKRVLCKKYGIQLAKQTVVEIFPEQKDFAVRTFGLPGGEGYLGVCFGSVITANSPASHAANLINWQSVLWHEFCHVVTLSITKNKMPRWLSEGISVYEERQANPAWGEQLSPRYREMIFKELTPVGNLSSAFLAPKTPFHLQFAYYQSSLVVEFLVDTYGLDSLRQILRDLGDGKSINEAIQANTAPLAKIEKAFSEFARQRAEQLAPRLDWAEPKPEDLAEGREDSWIRKHPNSLWGLTQQGKKLLAAKKWEEAKTPLRLLLELYPENTGPDNAYVLLAQAHRGLNETESERIMLGKLARIEADALQAYLRLMQLDTDAKDWNAAMRDAQRFLAVNPLVPQPYRCIAQASQELGQFPEALEAYQTLLLLDPPDPADIHYHLASLLSKTGGAGAKRHVLQALEEAPRFRDAHRLLLELSKADGAKTPVEQAAEAAVP